MKFERNWLKKRGFEGFYTLTDLNSGMIEYIPQSPGIYVVLREQETKPKFLDKNPGGKFKGMDPTIEKKKLEKKWVTGAKVIYIGKGKNLRSRIDKLLKFGAGQPTSHWGGRSIWQIEDSNSFLLAWKQSKDEKPEKLESKFLNMFIKSYGHLPFANLKRS